MPDSLEGRIVSIIQEFSLPKTDEEQFIKQMVELLSKDGVGHLPDEELFKIILSSFNIFFFTPINSAEVQFAEDCNLNCNYCFVKNKRKNRFSSEMGKRALDFLVLNSGPLKQLDYVFFGGEPLLEFDAMYEVMQYSDEIFRLTGKKTGFNATTNGLLLTEEIMKKSQGKLNYLLSIDGDEKTHDKHRVFKNGQGSFKDVFPKIGLIKKYQPWTGARLTYTPDTVEDLYNNIDFLFRNGIHQFIFGPCLELEWDSRALTIYEEQLRLISDYYLDKITKKLPIRMTLFEGENKDTDLDCSGGLWGCWAGRNHVVITYTGDIYPCSKFIGLESYDCEEFKLGNIFEGLTNLPAREQLYNLKGSNYKVCQGCAVIDTCTGGCPADNYSQNRDLYIPCNSSCSITKINQRVVSDLRKRQKQLEQVKEPNAI